MSFPAAIAELVKGKAITRLEWDNNDYCSMHDFKDGTWLSICRNGQWHQWLVNDGDVLATDWVTVRVHTNVVPYIIPTPSLKPN
jgi:hypothetical protein